MAGVASDQYQGCQIIEPNDSVNCFSVVLFSLTVKLLIHNIVSTRAVVNSSSPLPLQRRSRIAQQGSDGGRVLGGGAPGQEGNDGLDLGL